MIMMDTRGSMFGLLFFLLCSLVNNVHSCSCPIGIPNSRSTAISQLFCSSYNPRVYVGTVIGATCNCVPVSGERTTNINCQDYQLQEGATVVSAQIIARGVCSNEEPPYLSEYYQNCTTIGTNAGVVPSGLTVDGPIIDSAGNRSVNTTTSFGSCGLSCPLNELDTEGNNIQPCFYRVRVDEAFRGNITEGEVLSENGPDVTTTCGRIGYVLQLNQRYVIGIGGVCYPISNWDTFESYSAGEIEQLRDLSERELNCGAFELLPSLMLIFLTLLLTIP